MDKARQQRIDVKKLKEPEAEYLYPQTEEQVTSRCGKTYTSRHERHQHYVADQSSLYTDQHSLPGRQTDEKEGVDHSRYLASHRGRERLEEENHGHQIREAEREI